MYSGITIIFYRKTVWHVFRKPVQIEGITQFFSPVSCFSLQFTFLPLGDASVCSEKMAAPGEKSFCVLEYHTSKSVVTVQRAFLPKYAKDPPTWPRWPKPPIIAAVNNIYAPMLTRVRQELEYRIDVCRVTRGTHIEHLQLSKKTF